MTEDANNPYLPPKAVVADSVAGPRGVRPRAVNVALVLIVARALLGIAVLFSELIGSGAPFGALVFTAAGVSIAVALILGWFIARGRNWARIVFLVLTVLSLMSLAFTVVNWYAVPAGVSLVRDWSVWFLAITFVPPTLSIAVVVLLFGPGREWFRARSE